MKNLILIFSLILIVPSSFAQNYKVQKNESELFWTGKAAFNSYTLTGSLNILKGHLEISNNTID